MTHSEQTKKKRAAARRRKKRIKALKNTVIFILGIAIVIAAAKLITMIGGDAESVSVDVNQGLSPSVFATHPEWEEDMLTVNKYSRPGIVLKNVENIYVHYVANPGTTAKQNRDYFENLAITQERMASAHFIIDLEGDIIQCVPLNEMAYAVKGENDKSISIECCHPSEDGSFTESTYQSLIRLLTWLTEAYGLDKDDVLRHYDSNGKLCPLYYVNHEDAWEQLKNDIEK